MTNLPLDGLAVYPRAKEVAEDFRLQEALSADSPEETTNETPAEEKPKRTRRSRQTDKKE